MSTIKVRVIKTDGTDEVREVENDLDTFQALVGGWIEAVGLDNGATVYLNEEGKIHGLPFNALAHELLHQHSGVSPHDYIVGDVFVTGGPDEEGEETDYRGVSQSVALNAAVNRRAD